MNIETIFGTAFLALVCGGIGTGLFSWMYSSGMPTGAAITISGGISVILFLMIAKACAKKPDPTQYKIKT